MCKEKKRWKEKAKLMIDSMALNGSTAFYTESEPVDFENYTIEAHIWRKVALNMLKNVRFPAELYEICRSIALMNDNDLEGLVK